VGDHIVKNAGSYMELVLTRTAHVSTSIKQ